MKIVDIQTGWPGFHIIGVDCIFETDAKCICSPDETTGWTEEKVCNICGKVIK